MTSRDWIELVGVLLAVFTGIGGFLVSASTRRKYDAEAALSISTAAQQLIDPLNARIEAQERKITEQDIKIAEQATWMRRNAAEMRELKAEVVDLREGVGCLTKQIVALGHQPAWKKKARKKEA